MENIQESLPAPVETPVIEKVDQEMEAKVDQEMEIVADPISKDDGDSSSDTSSYHSGNEGESKLKNLKMNGVAMETGDLSSEDEMLLQADDGETKGPDSYARFKTQNEVAPELIEQVAPKVEKLDELDQINPFGMVV